MIVGLTCTRAFVSAIIRSASASSSDSAAGAGFGACGCNCCLRTHHCCFGCVDSRCVSREATLEETVRALGDLITAGKIRYFGLSNYRAWRIAEIVRVCEQLNVPGPVVSQPYYNAMNRTPEVEEIPVCAHYGIGVVPYSPLARGVLTGKYAVGTAPDASSRAGRNDARMLQTEWREESLQIAQAFVERARGKGCTPGQLAVAWVLNNQFVSAAIAGPRTESQWEDYLGALAVRFDAHDEAFVDGLVTPGHPSTPGYNDPQYPIEGRVPRAGA